MKSEITSLHHFPINVETISNRSPLLSKILLYKQFFNDFPRRFRKRSSRHNEILENFGKLYFLYSETDFKSMTLTNVKERAEVIFCSEQ